MKLYHGTPIEARAKSIISDGIKPDLSTTEGLSRPVDGMVYLSKNLEYAIIYLLGANMLGDELPDSLLENRYGYLFIIESENLGEHIQPDEDQVGEAIHDAKISSLTKYHNILKNTEALDEEDEVQFYNNLYEQVKDGDYASWIKAGHLLLPILTDEDKMAIIEQYGNVAHRGLVLATECWKFDKLLCSKLNKDASNFFDLAEKVLI